MRNLRREFYNFELVRASIFPIRYSHSSTGRISFSGRIGRRSLRSFSFSCCCSLFIFFSPSLFLFVDRCQPRSNEAYFARAAPETVPRDYRSGMAVYTSPCSSQQVSFVTTSENLHPCERK